MKLREKLERLERAAPKVSEYGQRYRDPKETRRRFKRVTLYTLFFSEEKTHLLRNHVFDSKEARTPAQWAAWFSEKLAEIHRSAVLPGLAIRTGKSWAVQRILGWVGDAERKSRNSAVASRRNKAKKKGRKNG